MSKVYQEFLNQAPENALGPVILTAALAVAIKEAWGKNPDIDRFIDRVKELSFELSIQVDERVYADE